MPLHIDAVVEISGKEGCADYWGGSDEICRREIEMVSI